MAGRGGKFWVDMQCPELAQAIKSLSAYDGKAALKIENQIQQSTKNIRQGVLRRIHDVTGYLRQHTVSSFYRKEMTGYVREKSAPCSSRRIWP